MNKEAFLVQLRNGLRGLPQEEIEERIAFYGEIIDDRTEEGLSEVDAVREIGCADTIIEQILADIPLAKLVKQKISPKKRLRVWEIVLLVLGSPVWLSLLIAALAVLLSLYAAWWSVVISLWAVFVSLIGCAFGGVVGGIGLAFFNGLTGTALIAAGVVCVGVGIFLFFGCKAVTKGTLTATKKMVLGMKKWFVKKEEA